MLPSGSRLSFLTMDWRVCRVLMMSRHTFVTEHTDRCTRIGVPTAIASGKAKSSWLSRCTVIKAGIAQREPGLCFFAIAALLGGKCHTSSRTTSLGMGQCHVGFHLSGPAEPF